MALTRYPPLTPRRQQIPAVTETTTSVAFAPPSRSTWEAPGREVTRAPETRRQ